jgi:RNA polymerase sigma-70 factor (ECF subfamily)
MPDAPLASIFLAHYRGQGGDAPPLEAALRTLLEAGRAAWPDVRLEVGTFLRHVAERLPGGAEPEKRLSDLHATDLYLACACAQQEKRALEAFERRFLTEVPTFLRGLRESASFADEVRQQLREKLLVAQGDSRPKIADYSGQGSLAGWLRVAAVRTALNVQRGQRRVASDAAKEAEALSPALDPELDYIKSRYRRDFEESLRAALSTLSDEESNVLRLCFVEGLSLEQIGALYQVNKSTISRRLARTREKLLMEMRRLLGERLHVKDSELRSLMRLVRSRFEISMHSFLKGS